MKIELKVAGCKLPVASRHRVARGTFNLQPSTFNSCRAFTLVELLAVIAIIGILAALTVPALKNLGKSNVQVSATSQMLDDIGRARQLAISQHTTVYMVFVPPNFWLPPYTTSVGWTNTLSPSEFNAAANLLDKQATGYNFLTLRSVGDQPGQSDPKYLSEWKSLPDGAFIATNKFDNYNYYYPYDYPITNFASSGNVVYPISAFNYTNNLPFPTATNTVSYISLPYIAFNYLGQLTDGVNVMTRHEYIPLAQGTVAYAANADKALEFAPADFTENPPGNSTDSMFHVIDIDPLTGRATLLQQQVQ